MRLRLMIGVLLLVLPLCAQKKNKGAPIYKLPQKTAAVEDVKLSTPAQPCLNYAWAVVAEAILKTQQLPLDQHFWVQKVSGGELCIDPMPDFDRLSRSLAGTYTLDDGRKFSVVAQITAGAPSSVDETIAPLTKGIPLLVFWKSRAYLLRGAIYDEYIYPNGQFMHQIRELKLIDPLAKVKEREVSFVNGTDDPADIDAVVFLTATQVR